MEKIIKGYHFRMYPTNEQKELIEKTFGCTRYIYNCFLENSKNKHYESVVAYIKKLPILKIEYPWLKEIDSCALRTSLFNLDNAYQRYFNKIGNAPKFKSKYKGKDSYRTNNIINHYKGKEYQSIILNFENKYKTITLPKLKEVEIKGYRHLEKLDGRIINATISKEAGRYYVNVCVEKTVNNDNCIDKIVKSTVNGIIGIDVGIKNLVTTSDGKKYVNNKNIEKYEKKIAGLNRWLSRSKKGSNNRKKILDKLKRTYQKLQNARKYFLHQISKEITDENDIIVSETLGIEKMLKNHNLSKQISDASWGELFRQLSYKSKWKGKRYYQINQYYASSQECSRCGTKNKEVKNINVRQWECPSCTSYHDRDINASENIMYEGLKKYMKEQAV